jgi:shikimate kinase
VTKTVVSDDLPVFLTGFMASGKSTVGELLARSLGRQFLDTDTLVEGREGRSIERIFEDSGEDRFRELEGETLRSLGRRRGVVVATGGGLFLSYELRRWMIARGRTVWLDLPLETVRRRLTEAGAGEPVRPLWAADDPLAQRAVYERRRAVYALAEIRVEAVSGSPAEVARRIRERLDPPRH